MLLSSCDANPLTCPPHIGRVTSSTASRPSRNLPRRRTITASHCSALRRLRRRGQGLPSLQHNSQSQKCLTTTRPGFCLAVPQVLQVNDALGASWIITRALPGAFPWRIC